MQFVGLCCRLGPPARVLDMLHMGPDDEAHDSVLLARLSAVRM